MAMFFSRNHSQNTNSHVKNNNVEDAQRDRVLSSKLYLDVPSSKVPLIYSSSYDISYLGMEKLSPLDSCRSGRICHFLTAQGFLDKKRIVEPQDATKNDLLVVHSESYLKSLKDASNLSSILEAPPVALLPTWVLDRHLMSPLRKQVGGSILAAKLAKERGWAINVGGGFHHSSAEKGGGSNVYADVSLCIHFAFIRLNITKVMIMDLGARQGDGFTKDFYDDKRVYILDMYNPEVYPFCDEARSGRNHAVELPRGISTDEYLSKVDQAIEVAVSAFDPEMIVYCAGTDVLDGDPHGELKVTLEGITMRDEKVFKFARERNIPLVMLLSGGYRKVNAEVIANSIINLCKKSLINLEIPPTNK